MEVHLTSYLVVCSTLPHIPKVLINEGRWGSYLKFFVGEDVAGLAAKPKLATVKGAYVMA